MLTIPEFYERRFDRRTRVLGGIMMALGGILNMGLFLQVGSKFLVGITGLSAASFALAAGHGGADQSGADLHLFGRHDQRGDCRLCTVCGVVVWFAAGDRAWP